MRDERTVEDEERRAECVTLIGNKSKTKYEKHTYPIRCPCDDTKYARRLLPHITLYRMFAHTL